MKHYKTKTEVKKVVAKTTCDICGKNVREGLSAYDEDEAIEHVKK